MAVRKSLGEDMPTSENLASSRRVRRVASDRNVPERSLRWVDSGRGERGMHMLFTLRSPCSALRRTVLATECHAP
jgi:hypothetical protein